MKKYSDLFLDYANENLSHKCYTPKRQNGIDVLHYSAKDTPHSSHPVRCTALKFDRFSIEEAHFKETLVKQIYPYIKNRNLEKILFVGIGNSTIQGDSFGIECIKGIYTGKINTHEIFTFTPSVQGITGIESSYLLSIVLENIQPTFLVMIDSLSTKDFSHLGSVLQISDSPLYFGKDTPSKRDFLSSLKQTRDILSLGYATTVDSTYLNPALPSSPLTFVDIFFSAKQIAGYVSECFNSFLT